MMSGKACRELPVSVVNHATTTKDREQYLIDLLENLLPSSDRKGISDDLRKLFTFTKHRTKHNHHKSKKAKFSTGRKRILYGLKKCKKPSDLKYTDVLSLNDLWLSYMRQTLGVHTFSKLPTQTTQPNWDLVGQQLMKADFHGALISVVRSKCPSLIGIKGIVLQDTKCTFRVLGEDNIIRTIPKRTVVFKIHLEDISLQLFGKELCIRPAERSVKKFKTVHMPDL